MSQRIDHIITVLDYIRSQYAGENDIASLRKKATEEAASKGGVIRNTILDTITRQLGPEITTVDGFEKLTLDYSFQLRN